MASAAAAATSELAVLAEYEALAANVERLNDAIVFLNTDVRTLGEKMRKIEKKFAVVHSVFRSSVYATVAAAASTAAASNPAPKRAAGNPNSKTAGTATPRSVRKAAAAPKSILKRPNEPRAAKPCTSHASAS